MSDEEVSIIDKVRNYITTYSKLGEFAELNVEYLIDKVKAYSINESAGYDPIINQFLSGSERRFLFTFDAKLHWNEEIQNNIDNSKFFEDFRNWLETNNKNKIFPEISGVYEIGATTNGYIFATNANEAIYRIQCYLNYFKEG